MKKSVALEETTKMWIWLYKHPAHDMKYYVTYVAKLDHPWKNFSPLCEVSDNSCADCLIGWEGKQGTFCTDPESPYRKWMATALDNPDYRTLYAGEILEMAQKARGKVAADA